ncbi:MAG TPA: protoporphyrinogen oxidase [Thermoanaerobaculia bacterium]
MSRTIVIGAGLSGLVHAYKLARSGRDVLVLEASDRAGGVVRTEKQDGFQLELGPNTVRPTPELWALAGDLGLQAEALLVSSRAPRYIDFGGKLHPLPMSPIALARTRLLSPKGKLRLLAEPFIRTPVPGSDTVRSFFARRLGPQVAERMVEPFVSGIFAGDGTRLSASACFPKLTRWERERGSLLAGALADRFAGRSSAKSPVRGLLSFREGLETLPRAIASALGGRLVRKTPAVKVIRFGNAWTVRTMDEELPASRVVIATPASEAARLAETFAPPAARALASIPLPPLAVLHLAWPIAAFTRIPEGFGHLVVPQTGRRILGAVYTSSLFPDRAPDGQVLMTVFLGGSRDPQAPALSETELVGHALRDLDAALGIRGEPKVVRLTRYTNALPQCDLGHESRLKILADTEQSWPGIAFIGNYRGGMSVGDVVRNALALE